MGEWVEIASITRAHVEPIRRLAWGSPAHGQPLAGCSEDRTVRVWSEPAEGFDSAQWTSIELPMEDLVVDVRFAPSVFGCKLAACTLEGQVRIFERASEHSHWEPEELESSRINAPVSRFDKRFSAALDWMPVPFGGARSSDDVETLAVADRSGSLAIWAKSVSRSRARWHELASVVAHSESNGGVRDVAWCPNLCRNYEIVATCGAGAALWRVSFSESEDHDHRASKRQREAQPACQLQLLRELMPASNGISVWRCSWNVMGSILSLCPEDREVVVWKADPSLEWRQHCQIRMRAEG